MLLGTVEPCIVFPMQLTHEPRYRRAHFLSLRGLPVTPAADWPFPREVSSLYLLTSLTYCVCLPLTDCFVLASTPCTAVPEDRDTLALGSILIMMKNEDSTDYVTQVLSSKMR